MQNSANTLACRPEGPWFFIPQPKPQAKLKLICFAYAGGNANIFRDWPSYLSEHIEVIAIQLPGRASRFKEPLLDSMESILGALEQVLFPFLEKLNEQGFAFAFFGHSMGASIAFELTRRLVDSKNIPKHIKQNDYIQNILPHCLIVSGSSPGTTDRDMTDDSEQGRIYDLPQAEFFERLEKLNGTPSELLQHNDLMVLMEPILRSDFKVIETWQYQARPALPLPIHVYYGLDDMHVTQSSIQDWAKETTHHCEFFPFPGDHFYLQKDPEKLLNKLNESLLLI